MRKSLLFAVLLVPNALAAQVSNPSIISVATAPSGSCTAGLPNQQVATTGVQYSCQNGTWGAIAGGSGSGTVNAGTTGQPAYYGAAGTAVSGANATIVNCAGTNDTAALQAALNIGGYIKVYGTCVETSRLTIKSNTTLDAYQATFSYSPSTADWLLINQGAAVIHAAQRSFADAVITASSTTITSATASFTSADVGQSIACANGDGSGINLHTVIESVTNGTTAVLVDSPAASVNPASCSIYTRDTNITLLGGTYSLGGSLTTTTSHEIIRIETASHVVLRDVSTVATGHSFWSTLLTDVTDYSIWNQHATSSALYEDGLHIQGPARDGIVYGTHCNTGDDCFAVNSQDLGPGLSEQDMQGQVQGLLVDGVEGTSLASGVRLYVETSPKSITDLTIKHVHGSLQANGAATQGFVTGVAFSYFNTLTPPGTIDANIDDVSGQLTNVVAGSAPARNVTITRAGSIGTNPLGATNVANPYGMTGLPDGSVTNPSLWFWGNVGTGFYRNNTTSTMVAAVGGVNIAGFNSSGLYLPLRIGFTGTWGSAADLGFTRASANNLQIGNGTANDRTATVQMGMLDVAGTANASFTDMAKIECPNLGTTNYCLFRLGKAESTANDFTMGFLNVGSGSADNRMTMAFFGSSNLWAIDTKGFTEQKASGVLLSSTSPMVPTAPFFHVSGTSAVSTITPPTICTVASTMCQITIIPDGAFTTTTGGNIAIASTAVVSRALVMTYDSGTSKWYPSY